VLVDSQALVCANHGAIVWLPQEKEDMLEMMPLHIAAEHGHVECVEVCMLDCPLTGSDVMSQLSLIAL
jgi:hypothetical protein